MKPKVSMREALTDPNLLAGAMSGETWHAWRVLLIAAMGEPLTVAERETFQALTSRPHEPLERVDELVAVVGRRGGKSCAMAILAAYVSGLCEHKLAPGERGIALCIASDQRQSRIVLDYAAAAFRESPVLRSLVSNRTAESLELRNDISIEVRSASFRRLRGPTYICAAGDEVAWWRTDDESANPDKKIFDAVRPGLSTTGGPLFIASSPYARKGELWNTFRRHYGADGDARILVAKGPSRLFNPSLPQAVVDRAMERDPASARAEYLAEFRTDVQGFVSMEVVEACVERGVRERAPVGLRYCAFVDPSGGSQDSMCVSVLHADAGTIIVDAVREARPPFSPEQVVGDFAALLKSYGVSTVSGDRYAGMWPREQFGKHGITYEPAVPPKSDLFRDMLPHLNAGTIVLLDNPRLVNQIAGLERRVTRGGRDSINKAPGAHDDLANSVAGGCWLAGEAGRRGSPRVGFAGYGAGAIYWPADERPETRIRVCRVDENGNPVTEGNSHAN